MEAKEKAEQLVNKMFNWIAGGSVIEYEMAKECALIAVDELIEQEEKYNNGIFYPSNYWNEVKQEIENL
jgi:inorganic pyrophosphatase